MNNTTTEPKTTSIHSFSDFHITQIIILTCMLIACLFGNILVIITILKTKKLRIPSNLFIVNLSFCDIMVALLGIPFSGIIFNIIYGSRLFPFGQVVCKLLWPLTTYAVNASVFTLAAIAIERFLNISSFAFKVTKKRYSIIIGVIHILALIVVMPYFIVLRYNKEKKYCYENWGQNHMRAYTISLFFIQYLVPLIIMTIFYFLAWSKLYKHNKSMIKMTEEYERKMDWETPYLQTPSCNVSTTSLASKVSEDEQFFNTNNSSTASNVGRDTASTKIKDIEKKSFKRKASMNTTIKRKEGMLPPDTSQRRSVCILPSMRTRESMYYPSITIRKPSVTNTPYSPIKRIGSNSPTRYKRNSIHNPAKRYSVYGTGFSSQKKDGALKNLNRRSIDFNKIMNRKDSIQASKKECIQTKRKESIQMKKRESVHINRKESVQVKKRESRFLQPQEPSRKFSATSFRNISPSPSYERRLMRRKISCDESSAGEHSPVSSTRSEHKQERNTESIVTIKKETIQRKMSTVRTLRLRSRVSLQEIRKFNKSPYTSQAAYIRHMQSVRSLQMFTVVVLVFLCFALPNQIHWLLSDSTPISPIASYIFVLLTYVSPVVNCWIYGGFNSGIRHAYVKILCRPPKITKNHGENTAPPSRRPTRTSISSTSLYTSTQEELFRKRMSSFNHMFEDYTQNMNNMDHLYELAERLQEADEEVFTDDYINDDLNSSYGDEGSRLYSVDDIDEEYEGEAEDDEYTSFIDEE